MDNQKFIEYNKTILPGVEVKRFCNTRQSYKFHLHKELTIGYIINGSTTVEFIAKPHRFSENEGIVIPPLLSHMCSPDDANNWQVVMLYIDLSYYENDITINNASKLSENNLAILKNLIEQVETHDDKTMLQNMLTEMLLEVESQLSEVSQVNSLDIHLDDVKSYITRNYKDSICLDTIARKFNMNKYTLIRQFKRAYNTTPLSYHLQLKIAEAKLMLQQGVDSLDICAALGFYDQSHFIREFKKMNGITPNAYLK